MQNFTQIPNELTRNPKVSCAAFRVFAVIASYNPSYPSYSTIQADSGLARSTVSLAIKELLEYGVIIYVRGSNLKKKNNVYSINPVKNWKLPASTSTIIELVRNTDQTSTIIELVRNTDQTSTIIEPVLVRKSNSNNTKNNTNNNINSIQEFENQEVDDSLKVAIDESLVMITEKQYNLIPEDVTPPVATPPPRKSPWVKVATKNELHHEFNPVQWENKFEDFSDLSKFDVISETITKLQVEKLQTELRDVTNPEEVASILNHAVGISFLGRLELANQYPEIKANSWGRTFSLKPSLKAQERA